MLRVLYNISAASGNSLFSHTGIIFVMKLLLTGIKSLLPVETDPVPFLAGESMKAVRSVEYAWLFIENDRISGFGGMGDAGIGRIRRENPGLEEITAEGRLVIPAFCDSHTHLVFAGSREQEFRDRIGGLSYEEIARRGGGILNSAALLQSTSQEDLYGQSLPRAREIIRQGTGSVEIKSGYGLTTESELKMLRVIRRLKETTPLEIRSTFLGAHSIPAEYRQDPDRYVDRVVNDMIPAVAGEGLADYIDVFCERGFFTVGQTEKILEAGIRHGMVPKIHANELDFSGGVQTGVKYNALSVDHLEHTGDAEIESLKESGTMPTLLPGASLFLGMPYAPARKMIDAGLPVALATDFNPGSSPNGDMKLIMSLACIQMKMLPEEALVAATLNSAYAMGLHQTHGSICAGKKASVIITAPVPGLAFLPYAYGSDLIDMVILNGRVVYDAGNVAV